MLPSLIHFKFKCDYDTIDCLLASHPIMCENHLRSASFNIFHCSHEHIPSDGYIGLFLTFRGWLICSICRTISLIMSMFSCSWFKMSDLIYWNSSCYFSISNCFVKIMEVLLDYRQLLQLFLLKELCWISFIWMLRSLLNLSGVFRTTEVKSTANVWCFWVENGRSGITGLHDALKDHFTAFSL